MNFYENMPGGTRSDTCRQNMRTDMKNLIVIFCKSFVNT